MILMPSNNTGKVIKELFKKYPDRIALLLNPDRVYESLFIGKYAVDNAAFKRFDETKFFNLLNYCSNFHKPLFVVAPDVVGCHDRTLALWHYYYQRLKKYEYPIAFVAQDGCTPETIPQECDWIFIGGTTQWKRANIKKYIGLRPIHVGRVNSIHFAEYCESVGVTSVDGTGWMRSCGGKRTGLRQLLEWFEPRKDQCELWPADLKSKFVLDV